MEWHQLILRTFGKNGKLFLTGCNGIQYKKNVIFATYSFFIYFHYHFSEELISPAVLSYKTLEDRIFLSHKTKFSTFMLKVFVSDPHFLNQTVQAFVVLCLTDCPCGKECIQQLLLTAKKLQLLFSRRQRGPIVRI